MLTSTTTTEDTTTTTTDESKSSSTSRGIVLATTVRENQFLMRELFDAKPMEFRPNIPNLVYQYNIFLNVESSVLSQINQEIDSTSH